MAPCLPFLCLGLLLCLLPVVCRAQDQPPATDEVTEIIRTRVEKEKRGVGIVVGLIDEAHGTRVIPFGRTALEGGLAVNSRTMFEIGSITKVFTSLLLAEAVARGEIKLDDPVAKYLPPEVRMPTRNGRQITLLDLATQRSGLPRLPTDMKPANPADPYADYPAAQLYAWLSGYTLTRDIGSRYEYSNLGVALLGRALAHRSGMDYEQLVVTDVCRPLGMADTRIMLPKELQSRMAAPHDAQLAPASSWNLGVFAGAGGLRSDVNDMLKFLAANLGGQSPLTAAMKMTHEARNDAGNPTMDIGLAWHIDMSHSPPITWHNGGTGGYRSFIGFDAVRHRAVVVLSNTANSVDDIGFHLLNAGYPLDKPTPPVPARSTVPLSSAVADRYVGRYAIQPTFVIAFTREGDRFFVQATGQSKLEVFAESETKFFLKAVDAQVSFVQDARGQFNTLILHQNGLDQPGARLP